MISACENGFHRCRSSPSEQRVHVIDQAAATVKSAEADLSRWQHMVEVIGAVMHRAPQGDEA